MEKPDIEIRTERCFIRVAQEIDKDYYMALRRATSGIASAYDIMPGFLDYEWEQELNADDDIYMCVFMKKDKAFVASTSIQGYQTNEIELGLDVVEEYRRSGIGYEILCAVLDKSHMMFPGIPVVTKMNRDNGASKGLVEKCGGSFLRYEDSQFSKALHADGDDEGKGEDIKKVIEDGKNSMLVYLMP